MSINASKTCAAKSAAKLQPIFELHKSFSILFSRYFCFNRLIDPHSATAASGKRGLCWRTRNPRKSIYLACYHSRPAGGKFKQILIINFSWGLRLEQQESCCTRENKKVFDFLRAKRAITIGRSKGSLAMLARNLNKLFVGGL